MSTLRVLAFALPTIWIAAGAAGLTAPPLRNVLVWLGLAATLSAAWPQRRPAWRQCASLGGALAFVALAGARFPAEILLLAVAGALAAYAAIQTAEVRRVLRLLALAALLLGLYRLAAAAIPAVWRLADGLGFGLGWLAAQLCDRPLWLGATFGGVDFLVVMSVIYAGWLAAAPPRWPKAVAGAAAIAAAHFLYLTALAYSPAWAAALPSTPPPPMSGLEQTPSWAWGDALRSLLPWNLPALAVALHTLVAALLFRTAPLVMEETSVMEEASGTVSAPLPLRKRFLTPLFLAVAMAAFGFLAPFHADLTGKTIVAYESGYVNWDQPKHDRYGERSAGMLGQLPALVESLGGRFVRSKDLSDDDLRAADLLVLVHPNRPWTPETHTRIWSYVRAGGRLLVAAESWQFQDGLQSTFNEILAPAGIQVRYDTLVSETVNWRHAMALSAFPPCAGVDAGRDQFGFWSGASLDASWLAHPCLVGRWGFADPGSDTANAARGQYDPGEKLGDLVLAAERRVGRGKATVLGDVAPLTNQVTPASYVFTSRLLSHLAAKAASPQVWWRELLCAAACLALAYVLCRTHDVQVLAISAAALALASVGATGWNAWASAVLPGRPSPSAPAVAYIDDSHLELHCGVSWTDQGVNGLALTLMRNGYLPLLTPEFTAERLRRAQLLIAMGPARSFSAGERATLRAWIEAGGVFLLTLGAEESAAHDELLAEYGFRVPASPVAPYDSAVEPEPVGCLFAMYAGSARVLLDAAWPVQAAGTGAERLISSPDQDSAGFGFRRSIGKGHFVLIGDSRFGVNRNLERVDGQPLHGGRHNAYFWRWLLSRLDGRPAAWSPPADASQLPAETSDDQELSSNEERP